MDSAKTKCTVVTTWSAQLVSVEHLSHPPTGCRTHSNNRFLLVSTEHVFSMWVWGPIWAKSPHRSKKTSKVYVPIQDTLPHTFLPKTTMQSPLHLLSVQTPDKAKIRLLAKTISGSACVCVGGVCVCVYKQIGRYVAICSCSQRPSAWDS